ncbi:hypothetical protein [Solimonas variicoloris]|uniref:hypothetical protein n=1 Tax=Solimonas variicoloris TaxID=254408 RepID=UPI00047766DA|nr:hypothetical protein [Solimonas variicoloris]
MKLLVRILGAASVVTLAALILLRVASPNLVVGTVPGFALTGAWALLLCFAAALQGNAPIGFGAWRAIIPISAILLGMVTTVILDLRFFALPSDTGLAVCLCAFLLFAGGAVGVGWLRLFTVGGDAHNKEGTAHPILWALFVAVVALLFIAQKLK